MPTIGERVRGLVRRVFGRERPAPRDIDPDAAWDTIQRQIAGRFRREVVADVDLMLDPLEGKTHTPAWFMDRMTGRLKNLYISTVAAGAGGIGNVSRHEMRTVDRALSEQRQFLMRWRAYLERTPKERWSRGQIITRAMMYPESAKSLLSWQQTTVNIGMPELPFQPKDRTICYSGCKCRWEIVVIDKENGDFNAFWRMSPAEHCQTCINRAAVCNPLEIRGGHYEIDMRGLVR